MPSPRTLVWLMALTERRTVEQTAWVEKFSPACPILVWDRTPWLCPRHGPQSLERGIRSERALKNQY